MPLDLRIPITALLLSTDHDVDLLFAALASGLTRAMKAAHRGKSEVDTNSIAPVTAWVASTIADVFGTDAATVDALYAVPGSYPNMIARSVINATQSGMSPIISNSERILREQLARASIEIRISRFTLIEKVPLSFRPSQLSPIADIASSRSWVDGSGKVLNDRIWNTGADTLNRLQTVMQYEIQNGTTPNDLAKKLEQFLSPNGARARKNDPGGTTGNYAAQRLARTEVARAHGMGIIAASKIDPFTLGVKWNLGFMHSDADDCDTNAHGNRYSLGAGVYPIGNVPSYPNHPNCLCFLSSVPSPHISRTLDEIANGNLAFTGFDEQELTEQLSGFMLERIT